MASKTKVSVTVDSDTLRRVDALLGGRSRSEVFEQALTSWVREHRKRGLAEETERYYRSLNEAEASEDREWASLGDEAVKAGWDERRR